jgi:cytoskeletal protein CcmA (bactofilin family)
MSYFRRTKKPKKSDGTPSPDDANAEDSVETSPRHVGHVGVVSGVLTTSADSDHGSLFGSVVERRFGPGSEHEENVTADSADNLSSGAFAPHDFLHAVEPLLAEGAESPNLEIDPMAHIGNATTIVGNIVAEEDLEIQGRIEGSVRLVDHRVVVGSDGVVKASVEARTVQVIGKITGNVVATEWVEIKAGGVIRGDVKAPRVIMADGAIVVGGLDMSAALPSSAGSRDPEPPTPERPKLIKVELADDSFRDEGSV